MIGKLLGEFYLLYQLFVGSPTEINKPKSLDEIIAYINNTPKQVQMVVPPADCDGPLNQIRYEKIVYPDGKFRGIKVKVPYNILDALGYGDGNHVLNFYAARPPEEGEPNCYQPDLSKWFGSIYIPSQAARPLGEQYLESEINPQESLGDPLYILAVPGLDE